MALLMVLGLVAAACGDDDDVTAPPEEPTTQEGGTLVLGAEQEPDCADWISSCAGASWGLWTMTINTMPRTFDVVADGEAWAYEPSILLDGEPELVVNEDGDGPPQVVTYQISEDAVWSDGEPITSTDFKYTWEQITTGEDIYDTTGYANVESVDDSDPKVAVVTFSEVFSGWKLLWGAQYGVYPSHILEGQDRNALMADGYDFSGGPWMIEKWERGVEIVLVPNENWWGDPKPTLDQVVFRFVTNTSAEFRAYTEGEVSAIYPQPQPDVVDQIDAGGLPGTQEYTGNTGNLEALWFNNAAFPFDDLAVRQAVAYTVDRAALVERLFGPLGIESPSNALNPPLLAFYTDIDAFAEYGPDPAMVEELMTGAGWAKNGSGIWAKDGETATFTLKTTTGNQRRQLTLEVVQEQLNANGFEATIDLQEAGDLFGQQLPAGDFHAGLYAQVLTAINPSLCSIMCSKNIPTEANQQSGQNWQRINIPELDPLLDIVDTSLDQDERAEAQKAADAIMAENMVALPLDPLPNIFMYSDEIVGPLADNPIHGPFSNLHEWALAA
jgi:peptide/nickel transport system substrate-binding protein